jgi:hypothetical protein
MWQIISEFVINHWRVISFGSIISGGGVLVRVWAWYKQRRVQSLSRKIRIYADEVKRKHPNLLGIPRLHLAEQFHCSGERIREALEHMETRGWAVKVRYPVDCWQIN